VKKQTPIYLKFLDHSQCPGDQAGPIECEMWGLLVGEDKNCYLIASWVCAGNPADANSEVFSVLKKTVLKLRKWRPIRSRRGKA
jgi:hypothetical protein